MPVQAVAIVVYEGVQALDVAGPMDVFSEANTFLDSANRYETVLVAAAGYSAVTSKGVRPSAFAAPALQAGSTFALMTICTASPRGAPR